MYGVDIQPGHLEQILHMVLSDHAAIRLLFSMWHSYFFPSSLLLLVCVLFLIYRHAVPGVPKMLHHITPQVERKK